MLTTVSPVLLFTSSQPYRRLWNHAVQLLLHATISLLPGYSYSMLLTRFPDLPLVVAGWQGGKHGWIHPAYRLTPACDSCEVCSFIKSRKWLHLPHRDLSFSTLVSFLLPVPLIIVCLSRDGPSRHLRSTGHRRDKRDTRRRAT